MEKTIITISREFGSGGRSIGKAVAGGLNFPYYDKDLINVLSGNRVVAHDIRFYLLGGSGTNRRKDNVHMQFARPQYFS